MDSDTTAVIVGCFGVIALAFAIGAFIAWIATALYNGILVTAFGFPPLTFWQVWGVIILINLVFGGLRVSTSKSK